MIGRTGMPQLPRIAWGTAGREIDTPESYVSQGDGSTGESGRTLVHCQLFEGRDATVTLDATKGQGRYVLAQLSQSIATMPPFGAVVLLVTPNSHGTNPGSSLIIAVVGTNPKLAKGEAVFQAVLGGSLLIARNDGTFEMGAPSPGDTAGVTSKIDQAVSTIVNAINAAVSVFNGHTHVVSGAANPSTFVVTGLAAATATPQTELSPAPSTVASKILKLSG